MCFRHTSIELFLCQHFYPVRSEIVDCLSPDCAISTDRARTGGRVDDMKAYMRSYVNGNIWYHNGMKEGGTGSYDGKLNAVDRSLLSSEHGSNATACNLTVVLYTRESRKLADVVVVASIDVWVTIT
ncbi:hypothetical protein EXIGLDRAFT_692096 [Exidia glandulosa HHB12029]|uniref:Uncharacterized protein n=1 Tax=Exidia glandulosa HHB12029 TaxID=1314781 RepID=A0A165I8C3_EXIGL|nr:hypothetical protein EXIGLDRAFT_692096 [Exidia glandulosa HHB12029]